MARSVRPASPPAARFPSWAAWLSLLPAGLLAEGAALADATVPTDKKPAPPQPVDPSAPRPPDRPVLRGRMVVPRPPTPPKSPGKKPGHRPRGALHLHPHAPGEPCFVGERPEENA